MKFTSSLLLLVLPAFSIARPSPQTTDEQATPLHLAPCVDGERRCDAGNTWSLCIGGRFVEQGVNDENSECTELQVREDNGGGATVYDTIMGLKFVGDIKSIVGNAGGIGISSTGAGGPREYPLLAGPSMNFTLIVTDAPGSSAGADGGDGYDNKNGTVARLAKRGTSIHCVRVCVGGRCEVKDCEVILT
ncbi:hypothetical protein L873DRAFT_1812782, partial [Choiromyces venosus 120613-1]